MNVLKRHWWLVFVLAVTALALVLRWPHRDGSLAFDEWVTREFALLTWVDFWHYLRFENTPPLFFVLAKLWAGLVPDTEAWLRGLPLLFGVLWIPALAALLRTLLKPITAAWLLLLATVLALPLIESSEFRTYSLVLFLSTLLLWCVIRWWQTQRPGWLVGLALTALLGAMSHLQFLIVIAAMQILFWFSAQRRSWRRWIVAWLPTALALSAWYWVVWRFHDTYVTEAVWMTNLSSSRVTQVQTWLSAILPTGAELSVPGPIIGLTVLLFAGCFFKGLTAAVKTSVWRLPVAVIILGILVGFVTNVDTAKYFIVCLPASLLIVGRGWEALRWPRLRWLVATGLIALVASQVPAAYSRLGAPWRSVAALLASRAQANDLILFHPYADAEVFQHYYRGPATVRGFLPTQYHSSDHLADILKYNFQQVVRQETLADLLNQTAGFNTVYYISQTGDTPGFFHGDYPPRWFDTTGWQKNVIAQIQAGPFITRYTRVAPAP